VISVTGAGSLWLPNVNFTNRASATLTAVTGATVYGVFDMDTARLMLTNVEVANGQLLSMTGGGWLHGTLLPTGAVYLGDRLTLTSTLTLGAAGGLVTLDGVTVWSGCNFLNTNMAGPQPGLISASFLAFFFRLLLPSHPARLCTGVTTTFNMTGGNQVVPILTNWGGTVNVFGPTPTFTLSFTVAVMNANAVLTSSGPAILFGGGSSLQGNITATGAISLTLGGLVPNNAELWLSTAGPLITVLTASTISVQGVIGLYSGKTCANPPLASPSFP
jgi:hypothetical protein